MRGKNPYSLCIWWFFDNRISICHHDNFAFNDVVFAVIMPPVCMHKLRWCLIVDWKRKSHEHVDTQSFRNVVFKDFIQENQTNKFCWEIPELKKKNPLEAIYLTERSVTITEIKNIRNKKSQNVGLAERKTHKNKARRKEETQKKHDATHKKCNITQKHMFS